VPDSLHPMFDPKNLSDQENARLTNLQALGEYGIDPFPARVERTHTIAEVCSLYESHANADLSDSDKNNIDEESIYTITGRIKSMRVMGKMSFADIEDGTGRMQLVVRRDELPEGWYNSVWKKMIDLGDFVGATGPLMLTKTGELSVAATNIQFLSKALKPMPDKWHGVKDPETRYRRRHLDLMGNPEGRDIFRTRAGIVRALREYLDNADFLEVETPILQPIYGGAAARPFVTHHNQLHQDLYLRISFELYLKRLLVAGYDRVYEIGRDFRNEGVSFKHNPEFTQLEFYEAYADYQDVMQRTEEMVAYAAEQVIGSTKFQWGEHEISVAPPWKRIPLRQAILDTCDIDYETFPSAKELGDEMGRQGIKVNPSDSWGKLVDKLMGEFVEPNLIQPTFLTDYPRDISPLAKGSPENERLVERFEGFVAGMELCNAFSELNDPIDQLQRFVDENYRGEQGDEESHPVDEDYIDTMSYGMPPSGGFGMGIDRLTMLFTNKDTIREVIIFPHLRSLKEEPDELAQDDAGSDTKIVIEA